MAEFKIDFLGEYSDDSEDGVEPVRLNLASLGAHVLIPGGA